MDQLSSCLATRTSDPLDLSTLGSRGWLKRSLVPLKGCRLKDTPVDSSYVVLGRYFRTVVAWARQNLSRRLATVRMFTTGETLASVAFLCLGREEPACESSSLVLNEKWLLCARKNAPR